MNLSPTDFPVILDYEERKSLEFPSVVPWGLMAQHERQAMMNHCRQTLPELAQRGGMGIIEIYYVLRDDPFPFAPGKMVDKQTAARYVEKRIEDYEATLTDAQPKPREYNSPGDRQRFGE